MKSDRREPTSGAQDRHSLRDGGERRSPALYVTRRDVGALVVLLTLLDSLVKLAVVLVAG